MRSFILLVIIGLLSLPINSQANTCNCCTENHSEFDFWIGTWIVSNPDGSIAGNNTINKIQDNCILQENWISNTPGYTGTSNNFYNRNTGKWEQIWIDNQGGSLHLKGSRVKNQMILRSDEALNSNGQPFFHRITWTKNDDGTVRQYWETITNGKDVTVAFDGLYKKVE